MLLLAPSLVALFLEPVLFLAADRWPRRWFVRTGLFGLAAFSIAAGLAPGPTWLSIALSGSSVTAGAAVSIAQATLVDHTPTRASA